MTPERLIFGDSESQERAKTRPRAKKEVHPTEDTPLRILPTIEKLVIGERERWEMLRREGLDRATWAQKILGTEKNKLIQPSMVSICLRWWGYSELGYKPPLKDFNTILRLETGSALHQAFENLLSSMGPTEYIIISSVGEDAEMAGKIDILFRNRTLDPAIGDYQIIELKSVSDEAFRYQLNREKLRKDLIPTKGIVAPREHDKKQVCLYLKESEEKGYKVACANIIYINRNTLELKEAIIPWDATTKYEIDQFIEEIERARNLIKQEKLPESTVDSEIPCKYYCDYRHVCDVRKVAVRKKRKPEWVRVKTREERKKRREVMEKRGLVQPTLGGEFESLVYE